MILNQKGALNFDGLASWAQMIRRIQGFLFMKDDSIQRLLGFFQGFFYGLHNSLGGHGGAGYGVDALGTLVF